MNDFAFRLAVEALSPAEANALRLAAIFALREGVATDFGAGGAASNRSLVTVARKLGIADVDKYAAGEEAA